MRRRERRSRSKPSGLILGEQRERIASRPCLAPGPGGEEGGPLPLLARFSWLSASFRIARGLEPLDVDIRVPGEPKTIDDQPDAVLASVARIGAITRDVLRCATATGATPLSVADGIVRARIIRRA
jgi:hypothetical protein